MKNATIRALALTAALTMLVSTSGCQKKESAESGTSQTGADYRIAVFVPGAVAGSPLYELMVAGVNRAAAEAGAPEAKVVEGGFNQAEWSDGVTALAAAADYDLIVTSNPLMPSICEAVSRQFPDQKFLILDGFLDGNASMYTLTYNQMEQAYLIGHMGGLITTSSLPGSSSKKIVGLVAGQEYPVMNQVIKIGFSLGLSAVDPDIEVDFRVVGNWYDASKGSLLAAGMHDRGVDVILTIAGSANQGVLSEARKNGTYVLWFDDNGYGIAPGIVLGSSVLKQDRAAYEKTLAAISGTLPFGTADVVGVTDGFVEFVEDDPLYIEHVPDALRARQHEAIKAIEEGSLQLVMPTL